MPVVGVFDVDDVFGERLHPFGGALSSAGGPEFVAVGYESVEDGSVVGVEEVFVVVDGEHQLSHLLIHVIWGCRSKW